MIRFCLGWPALFLSLMTVLAVMNGCGASRKSKDIFIGVGLLIGLWVLFIFNEELFAELWATNSDLTPEEESQRTESYFLLIVFYLIGLLVSLSQLVLSLFVIAFTCFLCVGTAVLRREFRGQHRGGGL